MDLRVRILALLSPRPSCQASQQTALASEVRPHGPSTGWTSGGGGGVALWVRAPSGGDARGSDGGGRAGEGRQGRPPAGDAELMYSAAGYRQCQVSRCV